MRETVDVAQLAERQVVALGVAGSNPVIHPIPTNGFPDWEKESASTSKAWKTIRAAGGNRPALGRRGADHPRRGCSRR